MTAKTFFFWLLLIVWFFHLYWFLKKTPIFFILKTWIQVSSLFIFLFIVPAFNSQIAHWVDYGFTYLNYPFNWIIYGLKNLW